MKKIKKLLIVIILLFSFSIAVNSETTALYYFNRIIYFENNEKFTKVIEEHHGEDRFFIKYSKIEFFDSSNFYRKGSLHINDKYQNKTEYYTFLKFLKKEILHSSKSNYNYNYSVISLLTVKNMDRKEFLKKDPDEFYEIRIFIANEENNKDLDNVGPHLHIEIFSYGTEKNYIYQKGYFSIKK